MGIGIEFAAPQLNVLQAHIVDGAWATHLDHGHLVSAGVKQDALGVVPPRSGASPEADQT